MGWDALLGPSEPVALWMLDAIYCLVCRQDCPGFTTPAGHAARGPAGEVGGQAGGSPQDSVCFLAEPGRNVYPSPLGL